MKRTSLVPLRRRPCRRGADAGFTLVELTVALVAGLIVAMGIVGLSKEATRTFQEESRSSAAEATLRTAVDRLRADLQRAAYMSTTNIASDLHIAKPPTATSNVSYIANANMLGIIRLAGIRLIDGGSLANTALSSAQSPALSPDAIIIGGNMTSAERFEVQSIQSGKGCGTRLYLSATSPAMYRVDAVGATAQAAELNNLFQPYNGAGSSTPPPQFIVRLVDPTGRAQYLATCPTSPTAGFDGVGPYVDVDSTSTPVQTAQVTKTQGGVTNTPSGRAFVNPVELVRWEIMNSASEPTQYQNGLDMQSLAPTTVDPNKYDLVRSFVDATDTVVPSTSEVVAEYAVDLDFAFTVESGAAAPYSMVTLAFDDATNQTWGANVGVGTSPTPQPQRIRIVRARVVTRTAQADRTVSLPVPNLGNQLFLYRYCMIAPSCPNPPPNDGLLRWARTRTMTTEVSLPNQATNQQGAFN